MKKSGRTGIVCIIRRIHFAYLITKTINAYSEYVIFLLFRGCSGYAKAPRCFVVRTLPVLLLTEFQERAGLFISSSRHA